MIDLETASTRPNAAILTFGAIRFNRVGPTPPMEEMDTFYRRIHLATCTVIGCHVDENTMKWWNKQHNCAKEEITNPDRNKLAKVLSDFVKWVGDPSTAIVWANGSDFDCAILREAYTLQEKHSGRKMEAPWKFWNSRDARTIYDLANVKLKDFSGGALHHALHDCYNQIRAFHQSMENLEFEEVEEKES